MDKAWMRRYGTDHTHYRSMYPLAVYYCTYKTFNTAHKKKKLNVFPLLFFRILIQTL